MNNTLKSDAKVLNTNQSRTLQRCGAIIFTTALLSLSTGTNAQPLVTDNIISWPDDGWYQVQNSTTYESLCEGGSSCVVPDGVYTVINHHTGQRFDQIKVPASDASADSKETTLDSARWSWALRENTLTFDNDDWYQVQSAGLCNEGSYKSVCEGVSECTLDDGYYQIVNHSSGEVWQSVGVGQTNVGVSQSGPFDIVIRWNDIVYNLESPVGYNVKLNGKTIGDTTNNRLVVSNISRGTKYTTDVNAQYADGTQRLVGSTEFTTEGPLETIAGYGRPEKRDTFNFEHWDSIPVQYQNAFPSDCLFAVGWSSICFSPSTRYLMEFSYNINSSEGSVNLNWEFQLPGDNAINNIEGLAVLYTSNQPHGYTTKEFALVADVTTQFGQSQYEISRFEGPGTFVDTYPILDSIKSSGSSTVGGQTMGGQTMGGQTMGGQAMGGQAMGEQAMGEQTMGEQTMRRQINLDGADLQIKRGPDRDVTTNNPFLDSDPRRLHIVGEYYEANASGDTAGLSGWTREGAFLAIVDSITGQTVSQEFYPGFRMVDVPTITSQ